MYIIYIVSEEQGSHILTYIRKRNAEKEENPKQIIC